MEQLGRHACVRFGTTAPVVVFFFFFFFFFFSSLLEVRRKMSFINPHAALWYTVLLFFESTPEYSIAVFFYM